MEGTRRPLGVRGVISPWCDGGHGYNRAVAGLPYVEGSCTEPGCSCLCHAPTARDVEYDRLSKLMTEAERIRPCAWCGEADTEGLLNRRGVAICRLCWRRYNSPGAHRNLPGNNERPTASKTTASKRRGTRFPPVRALQ